MNGSHTKNEKIVDIFFADLTETAQARVLDAYGLKQPSDANWDTFPITSLHIYAEESEG